MGSYEMMTLNRVLTDPAMPRHLGPTDMRYVQRRIHALEWSVTFYRWALWVMAACYRLHCQ